MSTNIKYNAVMVANLEEGVEIRKRLPYQIIGNQSIWSYSSNVGRRW